MRATGPPDTRPILDPPQRPTPRVVAGQRFAHVTQMSCAGKRRVTRSLDLCGAKEERNTMNAIRKVQRYIRSHPDTSASALLVQLAEHLAEERAFPVAKLYELELEAFELSVELMREWRLDRYYVKQLNLLDEIVPATASARPVRPTAAPERAADAALEAA
jgi:hypothetical protein